MAFWIGLLVGFSLGGVLASVIWSMRSKRIEDEIEWNAIHAMICRLHPDGADAAFRFRDWYGRETGWLGPHRAAGWWLRQELGLPVQEAQR